MVKKRLREPDDGNTKEEIDRTIDQGLLSFYKAVVKILVRVCISAVFTFCCFLYSLGGWMFNHIERVRHAIEALGGDK